MKNFKTPIEEILFRSSKIGLLAGGLIRHELTENQKKEIEELEARKESFIGLTDNQQKDLDKWNKTISEGGKITPTQEKKRVDYESRLVTKKGLTPTQQERLDELLEKESKEPELSVGAKTYLKDVWLWFEKGFKEEVTSKQIRKGRNAEEDGINLISFVDGVMYSNNNLQPNNGRVTKGHLTGAADVVTDFKLVEKKIVDDIKASWNPKTFMNTNYSTLEEWQGRAYLYLYDADIFRLRRVLVDCPPDVLEDEYHKFRLFNRLTEKHIIDNDLLEMLKQGSVSEDYPEEQKLVEQFYRNFLYEHSGRYTKEERVKTFAFERDEHLEKVLLKSIELGVEYYKTITLNMIE